MRWLLILAAAGACSAPPAPAPATAAAAAPAPDDAAALAAVHRFFAAVDRRDPALFREVTTAGFFLFEDGRVMAGDKLAGMWKTSTRPPRTRTCGSETLRRNRGALVYVGDCSEKLAAADERLPETFQGWNTVVLVPEAGGWKVALWQWTRSGIEGERVRWNDAYRRGTWFTKKPNKLLVETAASRRPGAALVLTMGQGRNALHLASTGWKVTGVDIAEIGVSQAREAAAARGLEIQAVLADIDKYDFGDSTWDMVTMLYAGASRDWITRSKKALRPGGLFVFEFFAEDLGDVELAKEFAGWEIVRDEVVTDTADWGKREAELVRFVARKPSAP